MTLQEAIEEVHEMHAACQHNDIHSSDVEYMARARRAYATAIATILNAVVKGDLK